MNRFYAFCKQILTVLFLTIIVTPLFAELSSLEIEGKPEKSADEIVGVKDANGRFCAAIQVISDMEGFAYDSYNGVVRVDKKPGMDMVFLQPDERILQIFKTGYEPMKIILSEIGIKLNSKEVWKIRINDKNKLNISLQELRSNNKTRANNTITHIKIKDKTKYEISIVAGKLMQNSKNRPIQLDTPSAGIFWHDIVFYTSIYRFYWPERDYNFPGKSNKLYIHGIMPIGFAYYLKYSNVLFIRLYSDISFNFQLFVITENSGDPEHYPGILTCGLEIGIPLVSLGLNYIYQNKSWYETYVYMDDDDNYIEYTSDAINMSGLYFNIKFNLGSVISR